MSISPTVNVPSDDCEFCNEVCVPGEASAFKAGLPTKRVRVQVAPSDTDNRRAWVRYQTEKCGPLEYNIYNPNWLMCAVQHLGYELDPRNAVWADGLAATPPAGAPAAYRFGCCVLEAKYSQPNATQALYVARATFVRTRERKWWLKWAYQRYRDRLTVQNFLRRRRFARPRRPVSFATFAGRKWATAYAKAAAQLATYAAFCRNPETPFNKYVVIAGEARFVAAYFNRITIHPGLVALSRLGGANWRT